MTASARSTTGGPKWLRGFAIEPLLTVLMAVGEWASFAGPGRATPPALDGGEWTSPV
jgi:hypothetical protein